MGTPKNLASIRVLRGDKAIWSDCGRFSRLRRFGAHSYFRYSPKLAINFDRSPSRHQSAQCFFGDEETEFDGPLAPSRRSPTKIRSIRVATDIRLVGDRRGLPTVLFADERPKRFASAYIRQFARSSGVQFHCTSVTCLVCSSSAGLIFGCTYGAASRAAIPPATSRAIMELDNLGSAESFTITATRLAGGKFSVRSGTSQTETVILADHGALILLRRRKVLDPEDQQPHWDLGGEAARTTKGAC